MGSFDGAETCELVGCYLLSLLTKKYGQNIGLYRDDGLAALKGNPQEVERITKGMCKVFRDHNLDHSQSKYHQGQFPRRHAWPLKWKALSLHKRRQHLSTRAQKIQPPPILKNIPESINKRLSEISSDKECFDNVKGVYQEALNKSGHNYNLSFNATPNQTPRPRINRQQNILWFNPPYSKNMETNVGKCFLSLIDKHFFFFYYYYYHLFFTAHILTLLITKNYV